MGVERSEGAGGGFAGATAALNGSPTDRPEEPPNKRPKLILAEDASALRKRILEYKLLRLKNLRERSTELLKEQYFLEAGGNMIDYVAWRKRPPAPALAAYVEARRTGGGAESAATLDTAVETPPSAPEPQVGADEVVEKARAEAAVAARIAALARGGLWAERRLPRVLEPPRPKTHWDYLLEEMAWLAQDFAHERKWKKQAAKKCARAVQKYFQDKALAAQKAEKAQELQLRKIAAFAAKEIRTFWANVEKVVEWKRSVRVERARKQALDEQLSYIVDRTERYSRQLAANLHPERPPASDDEFQPRGDSDDDEETIAAAEQDDPADHSRELDALRRESRLDLGELLPAGYLPEHSPPPSDYDGDEDSADDESTIDEQERAERPDETADELAALRSEADLDIDELLRRYPRRPVGAEADSDLDDEAEEDDAISASSETESGASERAPLESLVADEADGEDRVEAAASLAASLQPTGTTLSDTTVGTPVPRLLRHTLREYQQVGLHWLATMHARRLNGILADEMGLGKTIQTIALLAHLALERHDWGPHLVVAPTSLVLNWEYEFKKWCPAFKLLTYYGTIKERKLKRVGWTKANSFHVCITSYKLVVQDHQSFRRKRWKYLILDEAQNIKNFKSQRWQMLLNFQTERFGICWAPCRAEPPSLACGSGEGARAWRRLEFGLQRALAPPLRRALAQVHAPAQRQAVAFPHPRLLQYDCGKLQTLDGLLRRLRAGAHRVLIFTQMTRVLDVLEAFLSMHGHTYLRLDGATRVDLRQPLVDRFNTDPRIFAFILSTRSGGVGLNLTGADSVVFYDSDWNPTMDAQAQDRCHRIGQTRDVHVFRLVTAATVEENILRKAEQKRALGHLAIEDGHFTTSYLRDTNVRELFGGESGGAAADGGELESALAACEDEADAAAAVAARAEAHRDLAEFDESVPLDDVAEAPVDAPDECVALVKQLSPVERYAMRVVESGEAATEAERAALEDMRRQLRDWEKARAALRERPDAPDEPERLDRPAEPRPDDDEEPLTYGGEDARTKVWIGASPAEDVMPMWGPPTPPSGDGDVYCDSWARALYRRGAASEALLPPVRWRDPRAARSPRRLRPAPRPPLAPPSLFGLRPRARPRAPPPTARDTAVPPPEWSPCEDAALRRALRSQRLPAEPPAALAPNWEWLAELVNEVSRAYRSPRACRDRHDALVDPERARRKHRKPPQARRRPDEETPRPPLSRLEAMRDAAERRRATPKRRHDDAAPRNPKHAALLADQGLDYDAPPTPMEVATRRAERMAKEKLKGGPAPSGAGPASAPQRVVVAAGGVQTGKAERRDAATPRGAHLVYRQPSPAARHHLKILHHAPPHSQSIVTSGSGTSVGGVVASVEGVSVGGGGAAALRTLQLQQLALRRAARPHQHVVLAHLAPAQPVAAQPQAAVQQSVAASQPTTAPPQQSAPDSRH
ncbi:helicase domino isoform X2 [Pieris brassicae]|uniref:helicase domino isoform X2 n=1 Tax=Pieris brassicae TaxID=7116 RepID=UPI001E65FEAF|nr:helicase domino isoform X2 [Pieris brassicae]